MAAQLDDSVRYSLGNLEEVMSIRPFAPGDAELEKFEVLASAIREKRVVKFLYRKRGELNVLPKRVHPYHIAYVNNLWMLFAVLPTQGNVVRKFVLFRLTRSEITDERFTVLKSFDLNKELAGSLECSRETRIARSWSSLMRGAQMACGAGYGIRARN